MKTLRLSALLGAALIVGAMPATFAQTAQLVAPAQTADTLPDEGHFIEIKNVPSFWMAYQLDPKNNVKPNVFTELDSIRSAPDSKPQGAFTLPKGIKRIMSLDPQNRLLVVYDGNKEAIRELKELIAVLDQPLRQVEIEAQIVQVSPEDARVFGIVPADKRDGAAPDATKPAPLTAQIGFLRNNFTARLNALIAAGKAKIVAAPRVTAINNLSATLSVKTNIGSLTDGKRTVTSPPAGVDLRTTPTINGDDTITLLIDAASLPATKSDVTSIINLRDGDTISLSGLSPLFAPVGAIDPPNTLIFLTARIIRRAGDIINVPGT